MQQTQSAEEQTSAMKVILKSQYHAGLAMLREAIDRCPDSEWQSAKYVNAFWQVGYHALFFTHFYLQPNEAAFRPWKEHQADNQNPDGIAGPPDPKSTLPLIPNPYTKAQMPEYWKLCDAMIDDGVDALDIHSPESGFWWYKIPKLEHQLVNIRHLQHHTAQLVDRLRSSAGIGIGWVGSRRVKNQ